MKQRVGIQSVEVGFALLEALSLAPGPLMLRDLAAAAGMSAAKAHRYLVSFQRLRLVTQDSATSRYDLGAAALQLGLASLSRLDAVRQARERIPALLEQVGHTVALAVWGNHGPTIVHWAESPRAATVNLRLGDVMPLLSSATGRCFAAFMASDAITPLLKQEISRGAAAGPQRRARHPVAGSRAAAGGAAAWRGAGRRYAAARHRRVLRAGVRLRRSHRARLAGARPQRQLRREMGRRGARSAARRGQTIGERPRVPWMNSGAPIPARSLLALTAAVLLLHFWLLGSPARRIHMREVLRAAPFATRSIPLPPAATAAAAPQRPAPRVPDRIAAACASSA